MGTILLALAVLPVILLLRYIYKKDKYEKEPLGLLLLSFVGGMMSIPMVLFLAIPTVESFYYSESVFYSAFVDAAFVEELCKFIVLFVLIWWNKNFNEYMDGIVYAVFVGLGFACIENILYVFGGGIGTGIVRALLSVPGHFLFAVAMGYFFALAKFEKKGRLWYLFLSLFVPILFHGLFDYLLMINDNIPEFLSAIILMLFIAGDIFLWKIGLKYIRRHQESSQFKDINPSNPTPQMPYSEAPEYKHIDWNAGDK